MPLSYENVKKLKTRTQDIISKKCTISTIKAMRGDLHDRSVLLTRLPISLAIGAHKLGLNREHMEELDKVLDCAQQKAEAKIETLENEILEILREEERKLEENELS